MTKPPKPFLIWIGCLLGWLLVTSAGGIIGVGDWVSNLRGLRPALSALALLCGLLCMAILFLLAYRKSRPVRWIGLSAVSLLGCFFLSVWLERYWALCHFKLYQSHYQQKVEQLLQAPDEAARQQLCQRDCRLSRQDPLQVNFAYSWLMVIGSDIAYDPAGELLRRHKAFPYAPLKQVEHLSGDWYWCAYSD